MNDNEVREVGQQIVNNLASVLLGSLGTSGWDHPAGEIHFLLDTFIEPAMEVLRAVMEKAENPSTYGPAPEGVPLPGLHDPL